MRDAGQAKRMRERKKKTAGERTSLWPAKNILWLSKDVNAIHSRLFQETNEGASKLSWTYHLTPERRYECFQLYPTTQDKERDFFCI
jgi:hypothetical protein